MDPPHRRLAERRLVAALRRLHRRDPLRAEVRTDAVLRELRADPGERLPALSQLISQVSVLAARHAKEISEIELNPVLVHAEGQGVTIVDALVASGRLLRRGHRVRLPEHEPIILDSEMRARVDRLLSGLRDAGAETPRVEGVAARLGIPPGVVTQLRGAGELVQVGEGIDYPRDVLNGLLSLMAEIATGGPVTITRVRDVLRTSRRHAEALLAYRRAQGRKRDRVGVR